jgi:hypothetical protein
VNALLLPMWRLAPNHGQGDLRLTPEGRRRMFLPKDRVEIANSSFSFHGARNRDMPTDRTNELRKLEGVEFVDVTQEVGGQNIAYQALAGGSCNGSRRSTRVLK